MRIRPDCLGSDREAAYHSLSVGVGAGTGAGAGFGTIFFGAAFFTTFFAAFFTGFLAVGIDLPPVVVVSSSSRPISGFESIHVN